MSSSGDSRASVRAVLDAWRQQHADRLDPVRFHFIEALESRANGHGGEVRRILDEKLSKLLEAYAGDLEGERSKAADPDSANQPSETARSALGGLLDHIGDHRAAVTMGEAGAANGAVVGAADPAPSFSAELPALLEFRQIWAKLRTESQLRQSLEQVPANAGPLNSGVLVHRAITQMRELSSGYLQYFLSYIDNLSWMEQMHGDGVLATNETSQIVGGKKSARSKSRRKGD